MSKYVHGFRVPKPREIKFKDVFPDKIGELICVGLATEPISMMLQDMFPPRDTKDENG